MGSIPQMIYAAAQAQGVDPALALEVATVESGLNPAAVGPVTSNGDRAIGVMQLMPNTAAALGVDPTDPQQNIQGGVRLLAQLLAQYGDTATALAAYNWGSGNVSAAMARYGANWLSYAPAETQQYVATIMGNVQPQYSLSSLPLAPASPGTLLTLNPAPAPASSFSWGTVAMVLGLVFGLSLALRES